MGRGLAKLSSLAMLALLWASLTQPAVAQDNYPSHIGKIIVPYSPGGTTDALARAFAQAFTASMGQSFIVDNRPGAGGNLGLGELARAPADGYTLGIGAANITALAATRGLYPGMSLDTLKDFAPVAFIGRVPLVLVVYPGVPAKNLKELIALLKAKKTPFNYGSSGIGNTAHLYGELFKQREGVDMLHIPYKSSGEALMNLIAGRVQVQFATPVESLQYIGTGAVRPIAIAGPHRLAALPDVPTLGEMGVSGFDSPTWFSLIGPAGIPPKIIQRINDETRKAMSRPDVKARMEQAGLEPDPMTPEQFHQLMVDEVARWDEIVKGGARFE
jgi:tripartite-type tricarboxylate transporter receptor subunit TctC